MGGIKIKICGLFRECDVEYVNETRPDYAGFVFYPPSHRYVTGEQMKHFRRLLSPEIPAVGVFVDAPVEQAAQYLREGLIQVAQLHGQEDESYIRELRRLASGSQIWKAFRITEPENLKSAQASSADLVLLDNGYGTGKCFDWSLMEGEKLLRPFLLAGGIRAENVEEAAERFHPWGMDVSSGVETDRKKDLQKIREMITTVRRI